jgi:Uma2 family endonuclease
MAEETPMPATAPHPDARLTHDDFLHFPDDGKRHEIIDGAHYVTPSPNTRHQRVVRRLLVSIDRYLEEHPGTGEVFGAPFDVVLSFHDVVEPDLVFIAADQRGVLTAQNVQGPPALLVEVLSKSTRKTDAQTKRRLFERTGVREFWLVDPELDLVQVLRRSPEGKLVRVDEVTAEDDGVLTTPLLPGWRLATRTIFVEPA